MSGTDEIGRQVIFLIQKLYDELTEDKKIVSNFYIQGISQFMGRFLFFVFFMVAARVLGGREFGIFSFSLSICYLAYTVMIFGLDHLAVKWVARKNFERFSTIAVTNLGTTGFGFLIIVIVSLFFDPHVFLTLTILGAGFCFFSLNAIIFSYFRGLEKMKLESYVLVGQRLILLFISIIFLLVYRSAPAISVSFSLSLCFAFICIQWVVWKKKINLFQNCSRPFQKEKVLSVLKEAFPLALVIGLGVIYYRIDSIMIAGYLQMDDVGIYSGAYMVIEGVMLPVRVIMAATFPRLSQYGKRPGVEFYRFYKKLLIFLIILAPMICSAMYALAGTVFDLFLGPEFQSSIPVFYVLLLSVIAQYPGTMVTQALITIDKQQVYLYIALACTITNIVLNCFLIPVWGIQGAAWATVISDIMLTVFCMTYFSLLFKKKSVAGCVSD